MASATCLPTPTAASSTHYTLSAAAQLPTASTAAQDSFVTRNGSRLVLAGHDFKAVGPNIYWLGLDENVGPGPSYPGKGRVLEAMAIASAMGATTIRSQSLGISVGTGLSLENALGVFKPDGDPAWDAIDFAIFAARRYGLRVILPLTDQYDYYHGGIPTFLRWRNLSSTDFSPFYDLSSPVYSDFTLYIRTLLNHTSPYTNLTLAQDPTVLAFETGNELSGWTGRDYPPPVEWTTAIAQLLKELAPQTLVLSGTYGVREAELHIDEVDISDHFYPPSLHRLSRSSSRAASAQKPFLVGEYDWTNRYYLSWRWAWFILVLPALLAALLYAATPRRWWPVRTTVRGLLTCGGCRCGRARRRPRRGAKEAGEPEAQGDARPASVGSSTAMYPPVPARGVEEHTTLEEADADKSLYHTAEGSSASLPILGAVPSTDSTRPSPAPRRLSPASSWLSRPFNLYRVHLSVLFFVVLVPLLAPLLHTYLPSSFPSFLSRLSALERAPPPNTHAASSVGDLYWSLFGRDDACCAFVEHADGFTLHYPSAPGPGSDSAAAGRGSGDAVAQLTRHAWGVRGERPYWLAEGKSIDDVKGWRDLPVVACPQDGLRLANGTIVGGA
ncbi:hypothetical protein Rhopal_002908-T1 [Rhodotorula paludigena]|uniref:mannan endo-1,4-beta-mannosidase n=1 Tax=Rhodotorula paludigena TaxID=86838 RepID=A0AAV5GHK9_9BASI|nr:hypothetical protein Rhopal_002908-T1 [Rhodotorula paludigena]